MRSWESAQEVEFETRFGSEGLDGEHLSSTRIVRWLILKKKKLGCQAACLSLHLCSSPSSNFFLSTLHAVRRVLDFTLL